jgi:Mg-chelatase subunit ChlI
MPIFNRNVLAELARNHWLALSDLVYCEHNLNSRFVFSGEPIRAVMLAAASGEPLLLVGPPGTGKSALIRAFCDLMGIYSLDEPQEQNGRDYFDYLLTPFTEPGELFGFYDIGKLQKSGEMMRLTTGMMQEAKVVYLDEIFNGSSAILNSILTFLNERFFHDRGQRQQVPWRCFFGATNEIPESAELRALFDRFVLRCWVRNVGEQGPEAERLPQFATLLSAGFRETYGKHANLYRPGNLLGNLSSFRDDMEHRVNAGSLAVSLQTDQAGQQLTALVDYARRYGLSQVSNRRLIKMVNAMAVHAIYRSVRRQLSEDGLKNYRAHRNSPAHQNVRNQIQSVTVEDEDLKLFLRYFVDRYDPEVVETIHRTVFLDRR